MAARDEAKRKKNIADHGLDFVGCEAIWDNFTITREDVRRTYAEKRLVTFGYAGVHRAPEGSTHHYLYAKRRNMKRAIALKSPKTTSNKQVDPDNPLWPEKMLGPPAFKRGRGPQKAPTKVLMSVRLDADVVAFFKAMGDGYQTRINDELRKVVAKGLITRSSGRGQKRRAA